MLITRDEKTDQVELLFDTGFRLIYHDFKEVVLACKALFYSDIYVSDNSGQHLYLSENESYCVQVHDKWINPHTKYKDFVVTKSTLGLLYFEMIERELGYTR